MCTPVFIAALFTIARTWKQPSCPSTEEWIKMWHIYIYTHTHTMECYFDTKKKDIMPFAAIRLGLEIVILNNSQRKTNI